MTLDEFFAGSEGSRPGRFMHHLELRDASDLDAEVRGWLCEAWDQAD